MISRKHKKICTTVSYIEHFLTLTSTITVCISISAFNFFGCYSCRNYIGSAIASKICAITAGIKKYKSIKKKKKHDKTVLLAKSKLNSKKVLISKALIESIISHD